MSEPNHQEQRLDKGFAPNDLTDGREAGDWETRYPEKATKLIRQEAWYLVAVLFLAFACLALVWFCCATHYIQSAFCTSAEDATAFGRYASGLIGGVLGGTLFALKWLYHSVAKQTWHVDRRPWRFLTPLISGGLAFCVITIIETFGVFDSHLVDRNSRALATGFLLGFFSDNALAKLAELAESLLGTTRRSSAQVPRKGDDSSSGKSP